MVSIILSITCLQDLKTQNATLSSELALAIAVMEAVGLLPKDQVPAAADSAQVTPNPCRTDDE